MRAVLALDQGTTGSTALVVDQEGHVLGRGYRELPQHFPRPGWVEHEPEDIWCVTLEAARQALGTARISRRDIAAIGITNQRETTVLWDGKSGAPLHRAIVWQDRRTAERCRALDPALIRAKTGLVPDPYFSATKLEWLLRELGRPRNAAFGTVDSWLVHKLTKGRAHVTDPSNASRTMLYDIGRRAWDDELLTLFGVPRELLPEVKPSSGVFGMADAEWFGAAVERSVVLPAGYTLRWSGQYEFMERAVAKRKVVVPLTLLIIVVLLYMNLKNTRDLAIVLLALPFSLVGGIWFSWVLGYNLSVAVAVGFVTLFGVAAETGVVMLIYLDLACKDRGVESGTLGGSTRRSRRGPRTGCGPR